jgi:hypothetical protein
MKNQNQRKLKLVRDTIRVLAGAELVQINGGGGFCAMVATVPKTVVKDSANH